MKKRDRIYQKYNGLCAYSGTPLEDDWQIEHINPVIRNWWTNTKIFPNNDSEENMVPVQKIINHYKHSLDLEGYRKLLSGLHIRLKKVAKNPYTEKGEKRKRYILKVAGYFGITEDKPFSGKFYFETIVSSNRDSNN